MLLAASGVLAMAETSLVRMNRIKAKSLVDEHKLRGAPAGPPGREPGQLPQPDPAAGPHLPAGLGHPGRHRAPSTSSAASACILGIVFEIVVIFVFFEAVPKNWAVQHADRAALLERADRQHAHPLPAHPLALGASSSGWPTASSG